MMRVNLSHKGPGPKSESGVIPMVVWTVAINGEAKYHMSADAKFDGHSTSVLLFVKARRVYHTFIRLGD